MKFSFTYFPEFDDLEKYADVVELNRLPISKEILNLKRNWLFHFRYDAEGNILHLLKPEQIKSSVNRFKETDMKKPEIISLHLGFSAEDVGITRKDSHFYAISEVYSKVETLKRFSESLDILSEASEALNLPIAVENLDYHAGGAYEYVCEPSFIRSLLKRNSRTNLLLDVAHAEISAHKLCKGIKNERTIKYISDLPLERVIEIHLNSPDNRFYDKHSPATEREIGILNYFKDKMPNLKVINLEYNSKIPESRVKIADTIPTLRKVFE